VPLLLPLLLLLLTSTAAAARKAAHADKARAQLPRDLLGAREAVVVHVVLGGPLVLAGGG
jgi:hypothetical protein